MVLGDDLAVVDADLAHAGRRRYLPVTGDDLEARRRNRASLMASVYMLAGTLTVLFGWSLRLVVLYLVGGLVAGMGLGAALVLLAIAAGRRAGRGN